jgi:hypothetical protein
MTKLDAGAAAFQAVLDMIPDDDLLNVRMTPSSLDLAAKGNKAALTRVIRALRVNGFNSKATPEEKDTFFSAFYTHETRSCIWLNFTSTACRRVEVGKKMVEQSIYETVCDEGEAA